MTILKKKLRLIIFFIVFVILAPIIVLYAKGDIFVGGWDFLATGGIYVTGSPTGSTVTIDGHTQDTTSFFERDIFLKDLRPGNYEISVTNKGYDSWMKEITVKNNLVSEADVFMLPIQIPLQVISKLNVVEDDTGVSTATVMVENQVYTDLLDLFATTSLARFGMTVPLFATTTNAEIGTKDAPIINNNIGLWQDQGKIFVQWLDPDDNDAPLYLCNQSNCSNPLLVLDLGIPARRIAFLPGYDGVILVAEGKDIFAIQAETNPQKTKEIIYHGTDPDFVITDGSVYIKDGTTISQVLL